MIKPQEEFREYANKLDEIENEFGIKADNHRGIACLYENTYFNYDEADMHKVYKNLDESSFIGIMPNQWRPEVHLRIKHNGIPVRFYSFAAHGFNNYDGGFLKESENILKNMHKYNAPQWAIDKLIKLKQTCLKNSKKEELEKELKEINGKKEKIKSELENYKLV